MSAEPRSNLRVIVIDDDEVDRLTVRRALAVAEPGARVDEAGDGAEGLVRLQDTQFDCVLLDYRLPDRDGSEMLRLLRSKGVVTPVVVLTGHGDERLAVELMKAGAADYIAKNAMSPEGLAQSIRRAVRLHRVEEEARRAELAHAAQLRALADAAVELNSELSFDTVRERVAARARSLTGAATAVVAIAPGTKGLDALLAYVTGPMRRAGDGLLADAALIDAFSAASLPMPARSWLAAPLITAQGRKVGLLHVCDKDGEAFSENDEAILVQLAQMACGAVENARLYEAAQQASAARDDMIAIVSHDLRNPLNAVVMGAAFLLSVGGLDATQLEMVERMKRSGDRMSRLLEDLLDITRIEAGALRVNPEARSIDAIIDESLDAFRPLAQKKAIRLDRSPAGVVPAVLADRDRVQQALSNLLGNALKFTPNGGAVRVDAAADGDRVRVDVSDTGPGIGEADVPYLFDRNWQAPRTASQGAGLGLYITKGIVEAHGGRVSVRSAPGHGATFSFTLLVAQAPPPL